MIIVLLIFAGIGYVATYGFPHVSLWWVPVAIAAWYVLTFDLTKLLTLPARLPGVWMGFFARQSALQKELAHASHGAGVLALCALAWLCVWATHRGNMMAFLHEGDWQIWAVIGWAGMIVLGFPMLVTGWKASYTARDVYGSRIVMRCLGKLALAVAVWGFFFQYWFWQLIPPEAHAGIALALYTWLPVRWAVMAVIVWCAATALTKLARVLRGPRLPPIGPDDPGKPHGAAPFASPGDAAKGLGA